MLYHNPVTGEKGNCIVLGRGATAIYLALKYGVCGSGYVLLPANICYAAVLPVIYAGFTPLFCDVDADSGNVTAEIIKRAYRENIKAAVIPHMYGNPVEAPAEIKDFLHKNNAVLIEDCASLMTNTGTDYIPGTVGDYVVYSTGYSKTVDLGFGGLLFSRDNSLSMMEEAEKSLPEYRDEYELNSALFSRLYRIIRNTGENLPIAQGLYASLPDSFRNSLLYSIDETQKEAVLDAVRTLDTVISARKKAYSLYCGLLRGTGFEEKIYKFSADAVPWRFNLLYENNRKLIPYCLENGLPVSDWYPPVAAMFGDYAEYEGAQLHAERILNFPLPSSEDAVRHICKVLSDYSE